MKSAREIAKNLIARYEIISKSTFGSSELKLQKLMYLLQRQSIAMTGRVLFDDSFEGWIHGPVLPSLRFFLEEPQECEQDNLSTEEKYLIDNVIYEYGKYSAWELRELTHEEISWKNSRIGLNDNDYGAESIEVEDIKKDAEKVRIYDYEYDMYLEEFEEFDEEVLC